MHLARWSRELNQKPSDCQTSDNKPPELLIYWYCLFFNSFNLVVYATTFTPVLLPGNQRVWTILSHPSRCLYCEAWGCRPIVWHTENALAFTPRRYGTLRVSVNSSNSAAMATGQPLPHPQICDDGKPTQSGGDSWMWLDGTRVMEKSWRHWAHPLCLWRDLRHRWSHMTVECCSGLYMLLATRQSVSYVPWPVRSVYRQRHFTQTKNHVTPLPQCNWNTLNWKGWPNTPRRKVLKVGQ